jgi:hypothetical protein
MHEPLKRYLSKLKESGLTKSVIIPLVKELNIRTLLTRLEEISYLLGKMSLTEKKLYAYK